MASKIIQNLKHLKSAVVLKIKKLGKYYIKTKKIRIFDNMKYTDRDKRMVAKLMKTIRKKKEKKSLSGNKG